MYHPQTLVIFWYKDKYGRKWEHTAKYADFRTTAINLLEKHLDNSVTIFYTINEDTYELDYYNFSSK